jgi:hypothetical protein
MKKIGQRVVIMAGMREFVGATGEIIDNSERDGSTIMYRVRFFKPVTVPGVGEVRDDLWSGAFLRNVRTRKAIIVHKDFYSNGDPVEGRRCEDYFPQGTYLSTIQFVPKHYREPDEIMAANDADLIL